MTRVGFVGLGLIGSRRAKIAKAAGCEIVFAVDPDAARGGDLRKNGVRVAPNIAELAPGDVAKLDAVFVAVPHDLAHQTCVWALDLGANVLCEKPLGISLTEAKDVAERAARGGRKFCAGFNYRFLPGIVGLRDLLGQGRFGTVQRVRIEMGHGGRPGMEAEWKLKKARAGGGALIDPGIHLIDLARNLLGEPRVTAADLKRRFWPIDVEDVCALRLASGSADVTVDVGLTHWKNAFDIEVFGSDGYAHVQGRGGNYGSQSLEYINRWFWNGEDRRQKQEFGTADNSFERETQAFLDWVGGGARDPALSTAADGVASLAIVEEVYRSTTIA
jgi:predicted dehydrogenase